MAPAPRTVSAKVGVEIAQIAGEAGFIAGTAVTMVAMTLVVGGGGGGERTMACVCDGWWEWWGWWPPRPGSFLHVYMARRTGGGPAPCPHASPPAMANPPTVLLLCVLARAQGLAMGFVILRVEALAEEGKL